MRNDLDFEYIDEATSTDAVYDSEGGQEQEQNAEQDGTFRSAKPIDRKLRFLIAQISITAVLVIFVLVLKFSGLPLYTYTKDKFDKFCDTPINVQQVLSANEARKVVAAQSTVYSVGGGYSDDKSEYIEQYDSIDEDSSKKIDAAALNSMYRPLNGRVTSEFGYRNHPVSGKLLYHTGIDLGADMGESIGAALDGTVKSVGYEADGYGNYVIINHADGVDTLYAHCSDICVAKGENVTRGKTIAKAGSTGVSTGPHLHFEVRVNDIRLNPRWFMDF